MKKRNIKSITNIFDKSFDLSIFNQIYNDIKKKKSFEIVIKEPEPSNLTLINCNYIDNPTNTNNYINMYDNLPENPSDHNIINNYKSNNKIIRDNILGKDYHMNIKKKMQNYNSFKY